MKSGDSADFTETKLSSEPVFEGQLLRVHRDTVRLPDGGTATREYIKHPGAVIVIAQPDTQSVLMERQFRYPVGQHFIELPAGKIDKGEEPLTTAKRELQEECGYTALRWRHLTTLYPCIGYADERVELFLATELNHVGDRLDEGEFLEVMNVPLRDALGWVADGRISDSKTALGLLWAEKIAKGEW